MSTASNQCSTEEFDERLRSIHRRRAGSCQPKDNLGVNWMDHDNGDSYLHSSRRRVISTPHDNIGNACLPAKDGQNIKDTESKIDGDNGTRQTIDTPDENLKLCDDAKKSEAKKLNVEIGISNIRRPSDDPVKMRKPIIPKDNITACGQFIEKPSRTSWATNVVEKAATPPPIKKIHFAADVEENKIQPPAPDDKNNEEDEEEDEYYEF